jgi:hypothetical protein
MTVIPDTSFLVNKWDNTTKLYTGFSSVDGIDNIKNKFAFWLISLMFVLIFRIQRYFLTQ